MFKSNNYPAKIVSKTVNDCWSIEPKKTQLEAAIKDKDNEETQLEAVHSWFSLKLQKDSRKIGIGFVMKKGDYENKALQTRTKDRKGRLKKKVAILSAAKLAE